MKTEPAKWVTLGSGSDSDIEVLWEDNKTLLITVPETNERYRLKFTYAQIPDPDSTVQVTKDLWNQMNTKRKKGGGFEFL